MLRVLIAESSGEDDKNFEEDKYKICDVNKVQQGEEARHPC